MRFGYIFSKLETVDNTTSFPGCLFSASFVVEEKATKESEERPGKEVVDNIENLKVGAVYEGNKFTHVVKKLRFCFTSFGYLNFCSLLFPVFLVFVSFVLCHP